LEEHVELQLMVHEATQLASSTQVRRDGWLRRGLLGTEEEQVRRLDVRPRVELCSFSTLIQTQMLLFFSVSVRYFVCVLDSISILRITCVAGLQ
jgi:hypothetical protein